MMSRRLRRSLLAALLAALACEHRAVLPTPLTEVSPAEPADAGAPPPELASPPLPLPAPRPIAIPPGCDWNLSGRYRWPGTARRSYAIADDGARVRIAPLEEAAGDAAAREAPQIELERTADGFIGRLSRRVAFEGGPGCEVAFAAEILACEGARLTISLADQLEIDGRCQVTRRGPVREVQLAREPMP